MLPGLFELVFGKLTLSASLALRCVARPTLRNLVFTSLQAVTRVTGSGIARSGLELPDKPDAYSSRRKKAEAHSCRLAIEPSNKFTDQSGYNDCTIACSWYTKLYLSFKMVGRGGVKNLGSTLGIHGHRWRHSQFRNLEVRLIAF